MNVYTENSDANNHCAISIQIFPDNGYYNSIQIISIE